MEPKDLNNSSTAKSDQRKDNPFMATRENEVRELPAQPPRYTGTTRSSSHIASWYSQFNRTGTAGKTELNRIMRLGQNHDQQRNLGNLKTHTGNKNQPQRDLGSNPSTESNKHSIRKATDKYANAMQGSRLQPKAWSQRISTTAQQQNLIKGKIIRSWPRGMEPKDLNNSSTAKSDQRKDNPFMATSSHPYLNSLCNNYYKQIATMTQIHHLLNGNTRNYSKTEAQKTAAGSYRLHHRYPTSLTQQKALNKLKGRNFTYPKKLGAISDAYANRLHKGDVFSHLTSLKQTFENDIQTKRLSKRSPTLQLLLQSELSTVGNRRR
ncbi:hypothetical protein F511_42792 [Dorcoceras hygrometricum]|uniref:Uncharacterized protein n=1 Tax=Dorcoceras hygrometricum TaxID=472368 RepID=A0A2Z7BT18_9LAMI|nr:hypothetical protein F511_42792 [Dorcoceras hygrometricum]